MTAVKEIRVFHMVESGDRHSYYVDIITDEGMSRSVDAFYTKYGLTRDEARERALSTAIIWGDLFNIEPADHVEDGVLYTADWRHRPYTIERELKKRQSLGIDQ